MKHENSGSQNNCLFHVSHESEDEEGNAVDRVKEIPPEFKKTHSSRAQVIYELKIQLLL